MRSSRAMRSSEVGVAGVGVVGTCMNVQACCIACGRYRAVITGIHADVLYMSTCKAVDTAIRAHACHACIAPDFAPHQMQCSDYPLLGHLPKPQVMDKENRNKMGALGLR